MTLTNLVPASHPRHSTRGQSPPGTRQPLLPADTYGRGLYRLTVPRRSDSLPEVPQPLTGVPNVLTARQRRDGYAGLISQTASPKGPRQTVRPGPSRESAQAEL